MSTPAAQEIRNVDVVSGLKSLVTASADLIIADPPYGIKKDFGQADGWTSLDEWRIWCQGWLTECQRILKDDGAILLYGIHNYLCYNHVQLLDMGMKYRRQIIWHYDNGFCGNRHMRATYEPILWFSKSERFHFSEIREPYKSADRLRYKIKKNGKVWIPNPEGRVCGDVWEFPTLAGRRFKEERVDHPTQKPLSLSERLVKHFSPERGTIIIPFAGSGSECVAAYRHKRFFIGFEINSYFCELAKARLAENGWQNSEQTPRTSVFVKSAEKSLRGKRENHAI